ncbi:MAG TPA: ABC transporter permease [Thermomicrobiales bacterium]|nr:ABC transporter permease [Thermomicrobiales bacterium]
MAHQSETSSAATARLADEKSKLTALDRSHLRSTPGFYNRAWGRFRKDKVAMVALVIAIAILIFSFGAPVVSELTGYGYETMDLRKKLLAPGEQGHLLGTDSNGRDILTRLAYGGRVSMMVSVLAVISALVIGGAVGSIAGYYGGFIDSVLMRLVDVVISIPGITILLLLSVWFRPGPVGLAFVIAGLAWTGISRLVRGEVLTLKNRDYIDAARVLGASNSRIIVRHIFPNVLSIIIVWMSLALPALILYEATLSYLGFGVRIPVPSWGNMLDEAKEFYRSSWTYVFIPGFAIYLAALAFNLVGDGLRDALDPRLNE